MLQLNKPVPHLGAIDRATQLTNNTRHMLSRLGIIDFDGDEEKIGAIPRHSNAGVDGRTSYSQRQLQQGGGKWEGEQRDGGLADNEVDGVSRDERPCTSRHGGCGGIKFQGELARAFRVAVREDKKLKRKMAETMSRALQESRREQVNEWPA